MKVNAGDEDVEMLIWASRGKQLQQIPPAKTNRKSAIGINLLLDTMASIIVLDCCSPLAQ